MANKQQAAEHLKAAGLKFECATQEQLDAINSLSTTEVDILVGLKTRLNAIAPENSACGNSGGFVW
ncbi:aroma-sacti cluster domain-containing protein [Kitasatospora sp. NPDC101235]|uniref:aroma-sacti cluster domain-containing protein n=1 Tax=Kitasatospora sp. NPDC101235 TaxID=3364101 RepID=UPI00381AD7D3